MNYVETEPGIGFTIKANMIRQGVISSTHLYSSATAWHEDNRATSNDLGISNKDIIEAQSQIDLVKSRNKEAKLNSRGSISMETDDKQDAVEQLHFTC